MGRPLSTRISTEEVIRLYKAGHTATAIAARLHTVQSVILRRLDRFGVGRRSRGAFSRVPLKSVVDLYASGVNVREVARQLGTSRAAVKWRLKKAGIAIRQKVRVDRAGAKNPQWRGGKSNARGYIRVNVGPSKHAMEHRLVMARVLGRDLVAGEIVHHLNGVRDDNRPENLTVTTLKNHEHYTYVKQLQKRIRDLESHIKSHG